MNCAEFEILLCDYVDGTLDQARRTELETHQQECAACAELAKDVAGAVAFLERVPDVEPPHELLSKISFQIPPENIGKRGAKARLASWIQPIVQPRFAMGMAMTILSFSMLGRFTPIDVQQLKPSDLHPVKVWAAVDDRAHRVWGRAVKYYENLRLVYEVQSRLQEWSEQDDRRQNTTSEGKEQK
jgi:anti-sigma factor RsiW